MSPEPTAELEREDEFYVGYSAEMPPHLASWLRTVVLAIAVIALLIATVLAINQTPFDRSYFEFGTPRTFVGSIDLEPIPQLLVARPGRKSLSDSPPHSRYLIVARGKHGAEDQLRELDGRAVQLEGTLIHRDHQVMIELVAGGVEPLDHSSSPSPDGARASLGRQTLRGEIVDSKCFFGAMKPGRGTPHRACASLCLRGGIPPLFVVDENGSLGYYVLVVAPDDSVVLEMVGEPIEITGEVSKIGDLRVLTAAPEAFERL